MAEIISLTELIETRLKQQQEIEYYQESLERLQKKTNDPWFITDASEIWLIND